MIHSSIIPSADASAFSVVDGISSPHRGRAFSPLQKLGRPFHPWPSNTVFREAAVSLMTRHGGGIRYPRAIAAACYVSSSRKRPSIGAITSRRLEMGRKITFLSDELS